MERTVTGAKRRRLEEEEEELGVDRISQLPDAILSEIVSLLPTKDGGRTQVLSSRWRHVWRSAPLNIDMVNGDVIPIREIPVILSSHPGPGRRFSIHMAVMEDIDNHPAAILDGWLQSPALSNLQELEFDYVHFPMPQLPRSVHRFSSTLRVASFRGCSGFPDGDSGNALQLPVLRKLSLSTVGISDSSMRALLDGCPVLESMLLHNTSGLLCIRVVSATLRSLAVRPGGNPSLKQVIIDDAPSLNRLLLIPSSYERITISVVSAPKLESIGPLCDYYKHTLRFGTTVLQGSHIVNLMTLMPSVKVLSLRQKNLSLDAVINLMKCFPCLETLYIKTSASENGEKNVWSCMYQDLIRTLDTSLKKIVLTDYCENKSHVNFGKFFVLNARVLQSMIFEVAYSRISISSEWIESQHRLLHTKDRASRGARFVFVDYTRLESRSHVRMHEFAHDLSTADPFVRMNDWTYY